MTDMTEIVPEAQAALDRATARLDAGDPTAALSDCDAALQAAPQWAEAHNLRGIVLDQMGRTGEAIASYLEALRLDPTFADAAQNLAELRRESAARRWPWKRLAAVALPVVILVAVVVTVAVLQARRGPDWRLTLNEYIAQRAQSQEVVTVKRTVAARQPVNFLAAMGTRVPGGPLWEGVSPVFPPQAVQCVLLETSADGGREVVYLALHSNEPHRVGWRVYEGPGSPFVSALLADLQTIGCDLPLE